MLTVFQGDLVDFGAYGKLYVCNPEYHEDYFWVTDDEYERFNKHAHGWSILKDLAIKVIETSNDDEDIDECIHTGTDEKCLNCYRLEYIINNLPYAIIVIAPTEEEAKSLLLMRGDSIEKINGISLATEKDKDDGVPILTESTPLDEAEEFLVSYVLPTIDFSVSGRIKADGERDAKKRFSRLKPDAKITNVRRANNKEDKITPLISSFCREKN